MSTPVSAALSVPMTAPVSAQVEATSAQLRAAVPGDALCLSVLAMQVFLHTYATRGVTPALAREAKTNYCESLFAAALQDTSTHLWVAEQAGHLLGFVQLQLGAKHALVEGQQPAQLIRLYVQEHFVGQGLGARLLAQAEQLARQAGARVLWLTAWEYNWRARQFYQHKNYHDCGQTHYVFEDEAHPNRVYAKEL